MLFVLRRLTACVSGPLQRLTACFSAPFSLTISLKSADLEVKGIKNKIFTLDIMFRNGIHIKYQKNFYMIFAMVRNEEGGGGVLYKKQDKEV